MKTRNRLNIKKVLNYAMPGSRKLPLRWYEILLNAIGISVKRRYARMETMRCTSVQRAIQYIHQCKEKIVYAEYYDGKGKCVTLIRDGKPVESLITVNKITKRIERVHEKK